MSYKEDFFSKMQENIELQDNAQKSQDATYSLSKNLPVSEIKGDTFYDVVIGDIHGDYEGLVNLLTSVRDIPNVRIKFIGDYGKIAKVNSKTSAHNSKSVQIELDSIVWAIRTSGVDVNKIDLFTSGNHEDRYYDDGGVEFARMLARSLGIEDRYARTMAYLTYDWVDFKDKVKTTTFGVFAGHGEGKSGNPGKEIDQSFNSTFFPGARVIIKGDSHKQVNGNQMISTVDHGQKGMVQRPVTYFNSGTFISEEDYLQEKGIRARATVDGNILRYHATANHETNMVDVSVDQINVRQLLNNVQVDFLTKLRSKLEKMEAHDFKSRDEILRCYKAIANTVIEPSGPQKHYRHPKTLRIIPLSGLCVGNKELENGKQIEQMVATIEKMDDAKVILNGDFLFYKKADFWKKQKYPEDSFARIQELAELLKPIKEKIIAINLGKQEIDIMKWHAEEVADFAMKELQLKENEAWEPMSATQIKIEQRKVQGVQCRRYNEEILAKYVDAYTQNDDKLKEILAYAIKNEEQFAEILKKCKTANGYNENRLTTKQVETLLVSKLREEGKLLDYTKDKKKIDKMFPLDEISLRQPNKYLIQNILCKIWDISPKSITMTSDVNQDNYNYLKITDENNEIKILNIISSYSKASISRGTISTRLSSKHTGADLFITNGPEYVERTRSASVDSTGARHVDDVINISGGRLDQPNSINKIYEIRVENSSRKRIASGIFEDTADTITTVSSISYDLVKTDTNKNVFKNAVKDMVSKSLSKSLDIFKMKATDREKKIEDAVLKTLDRKDL